MLGSRDAGRRGREVRRFVDVKRAAGTGYAIVSTGVVAFQIALAAGAPWGSYAMGGAFPGQFPPAMRVAAIVQAAVLILMAGVVLAGAGVAFRTWSRASRWLVWIVVAFATVSLALNLTTPSASERVVWAPVAFVLLACSLLVATARRATTR
jgi:hypothetical protein